MLSGQIGNLEKLQENVFSELEHLGNILKRCQRLNVLVKKLAKSGRFAKDFGPFAITP